MYSIRKIGQVRGNSEIVIFNTVYIRQRGLQINPFKDVIITFFKSKVLTKSIMGGINKKPQPFQTDELRDILTCLFYGFYLVKRVSDVSK